MSLSQITELRTRARRDIHGAFSVAAVYSDDTLDEPVPVSVRWHHRIDRFGDLDAGGYAEVVDGVERLIFDRDELAEKGLQLRRHGLVTLTETGWSGIALRLDTREPYDGPVEEIWGVAALGT